LIKTLNTIVRVLIDSSERVANAVQKVDLLSAVLRKGRHPPYQSEDTQRPELSQFEFEDGPLDLFWPDSAEGLTDSERGEDRGSHLQHDVAVQLG
jgi:hypothetical protein